MKTKYPTVCTLFYWFVGLWHSNLYYFCHCDSSAQQMIRSLARSRLMVLTSRMEGGQCRRGVDHRGDPVLSTRISGSIALLGEDYPGFFETGDVQELRHQLLHAERPAEF